jgi:hypothetical protein
MSSINPNQPIMPQQGATGSGKKNDKSKQGLEGLSPESRAEAEKTEKVAPKTYLEAAGGKSAISNKAAPIQESKEGIQQIKPQKIITTGPKTYVEAAGGDKPSFRNASEGGRTLLNANLEKSNAVEEEGQPVQKEVPQEPTGFAKIWRAIFG